MLTFEGPVLKETLERDEIAQRLAVAAPPEQGACGSQCLG